MADTEAVASDQLRAIVERVERMNEEIRALNDDKKEIFAEAKGNGFDTKALKRVVQIRAMDHAERMEQEALVELYLSALGMGDGEATNPLPSRAPARAREDSTVVQLRATKQYRGKSR